MRLRVGTWNMNHWQGSRAFHAHTKECWGYVDDLDLNIALVQEAVPPPADAPNTFLWKPIGGTRPWGTGIFCPHEGLRLREIPAVPLGTRHNSALSKGGVLEESHAGCVKAADVHLADDTYVLTVVSIYGMFSDPGLNAVRYVPATVHRMLSDLTPLLDRSRRRVLLGGDLNISPQVGFPDTRHHEVVIERIKAFGLVDLLGRFHDDYVQTYRHPRSEKPWQDDWMFASKKLTPHVLSCEPVQAEDAWRLSDHCPVVAEVDL